MGSLTVHTIDEVLFPPWSAPAKVLTPQQVLAFEGWAPEVINGRLAMLGFLTCVVQAGSPPITFACSLNSKRVPEGIIHISSNHIRVFAQLKADHPIAFAYSLHSRLTAEGIHISSNHIRVFAQLKAHT